MSKKIRRWLSLGDWLGLWRNLRLKKLVDVELVVIWGDHVSRYASQIVALDAVILFVRHLDLKLVDILLLKLYCRADDRKKSNSYITGVH